MRHGKGEKMTVILDIETLMHMSLEARLDRIRAYPKKGVRINNSTNTIEMIVRNRNKKQIWIPACQCMRGKFTVEQIEDIKYAIRK